MFSIHQVQCIVAFKICVKFHKIGKRGLSFGVLQSKIQIFIPKKSAINFWRLKRLKTKQCSGKSSIFFFFFGGGGA